MKFGIIILFSDLQRFSVIFGVGSFFVLVPLHIDFNEIYYCLYIIIGTFTDILRKIHLIVIE